MGGVRNLVTGATGFIGSHIAERLIKDREEVVALVRKTSNTAFLSGIGVKFAYGDINDLESVKKAMQGIDVVYHSAALADEWISRKKAYHVNVEGTRNLLDAARAAKVKRFVFISSLAVLGMKTGATHWPTCRCSRMRQTYNHSQLRIGQSLRA